MNRLIMVTVLLLRMNLLLLGGRWIDFHVLKLFSCRHQFHVTIEASVLLRLCRVLLRHDDLQLLVVLVRERWCVARHEHDVLTLWLESLSGRTGGLLRTWVERLLVRLTGRGSRRWRRRNQVRDLSVRLSVVTVHSHRSRWICL